ncbi:hypothetical protein [Cyclobacterium amurskyense]|uniref:Uncharacterized protein n=1 Tax=Cyclobacterium amurskyense TaxID=320787 RepID=A0A0H4PFH1_9BACT|nr:hypothetical protein [Cyclobacterium amurskyense]AKP51573.1 hypothetical protein CA2015_2152 [Cyclobacterium amurskyense]
MELPIGNKNHAVSKILALYLLLITVSIFYVFNNRFKVNWEIIIAVYLISIVSSYFYIKKQNILKGTLLEDKIVLNYNNKVIEIPLFQIQNIIDSLNYYMKFHGNLSLLYKIELNTDYKFGRIIYLEFDKKDELGVDPMEVSILKERIKKVQNI